MQRSFSNDSNNPNQGSNPVPAAASVRRQPGLFIQEGYRSLELIANDFLETLPLSPVNAKHPDPAVLERSPFWLLIRALGEFCRQRWDTNITFSAAGLLWRVSDHLLERAAELRVSSPEPSQAASLVDALAFALFERLRGLCFDVRSEVRNSAIKTLRSVVLTHAKRLSFAVWWVSGGVPAMSYSVGGVCRRCVRPYPVETVEC